MNESGNMDRVWLTKEKLNVEEIYNSVCSPEYGAVTLFVGTTRNSFEGKVVEKLEYEAYDKMAVKSLEGICRSIREKFQVGKIAIVHRLGDVPVQEASVVIAISATHRKAVFEALPFAIDALKADVPIWKKEVYQGGDAPQWKENAESGEMNINSDCIQFREEVVEAESVDQVSSDLIQINTNLQEINRRITSFINRKRQQVNISNVEDFCVKRSDEESTCARTNAVIFRRKDSKTHLKVHRVENMTGPQIRTPETVKTQPQERAEFGTCPAGAEERLSNAEHFLNIKNDSQNVFSRLKVIEDKILYLESISPEYFDFFRQTKPSGKSTFSPIAKKKYSSEDIDMKLSHLKSKFMKR
ncbi:UNVERIFIED_CONTAM: hypothetical protein PYX00_007449 [Menopon gallinae]|uniref:Molybdopterin synthase catalytic subunit n=1 Tax=Menopon gallinae TaxID=328185 RepID=A0AAW2HIZ9_9NEOP